MPVTQATQAAWAHCLETEKRLRNELRKKSFWDGDVRRLRGTLQQAYEALLFSNYAFALGHEAEQAMWKGVFYKPIEEFRSHTKDLNAKLQQHALGGARWQGAGDSSQVNGAPEVRGQLSKLTGAYLKFLDEATATYKRLVWKLQWVYGSVGARVELDASVQNDIQQTLPRADPGANTDVRGSCHRSLIYLGDLARYQSQAMKGAKPEWQRAVAFYRSAAAVMPRNGNPHNQLAVMAYYVGDELRAVYCYMRALAVECPFVTARENLLLLFEKNRSRYQDIAARHAAAALQGGAAGQGAVQAAADLSTRWVRLHGLLFDRINMEQFPEVLRHALRDLEHYLGDPACRDALQRCAPQDHPLLQLSVLCIFSAASAGVGESAASSRSGGGAASRPSYQDAAQRGVVRRHAARVAFEFGSRVIDAAAFAQSGSAPGSAAMLVSAHLILLWLMVTPAAAASEDGGDGDDAAARTRLWRAAARLAQSCGAAAAAQHLDLAALGLLPEDVELAGFEPLRAVEEAAVADVCWPKLGAERETAGRLIRVLATLKIVASQPAVGAGAVAPSARRDQPAGAWALFCGAVRDAVDGSSRSAAPTSHEAGALATAAEALLATQQQQAQQQQQQAQQQAQPPVMLQVLQLIAATAGEDDDDEAMEEGEHIVFQPALRRVTTPYSSTANLVALAAAHPAVGGGDAAATANGAVNGGNKAACFMTGYSASSQDMAMSKPASRDRSFAESGSAGGAVADTLAGGAPLPPVPVAHPDKMGNGHGSGGSRTSSPGLLHKGAALAAGGSGSAALVAAVAGKASRGLPPAGSTGGAVLAALPPPHRRASPAHLPPAAAASAAAVAMPPPPHLPLPSHLPLFSHPVHGTAGSAMEPDAAVMAAFFDIQNSRPAALPQAPPPPVALPLPDGLLAALSHQPAQQPGELFRSGMYGAALAAGYGTFDHGLVPAARFGGSHFPGLRPPPLRGDHFGNGTGAVGAGGPFGPYPSAGNGGGGYAPGGSAAVNGTGGAAFGPSYGLSGGAGVSPPLPKPSAQLVGPGSGLSAAAPPPPLPSSLGLFSAAGSGLSDMYLRRDTGSGGGAGGGGFGAAAGGGYNAANGAGGGFVGLAFNGGGGDGGAYGAAGSSVNATYGVAANGLHANTPGLGYAYGQAANRDFDDIAVSVVDTVLGSSVERRGAAGGPGSGHRGSGGDGGLFGGSGFGLAPPAGPVWPSGDSTRALNDLGDGGRGGGGVHSFVDFFVAQQQQQQQHHMPSLLSMGGGQLAGPPSHQWAAPQQQQQQQWVPPTADGGLFFPSLAGGLGGEGGPWGASLMPAAQTLGPSYFSGGT